MQVYLIVKALVFMDAICLPLECNCVALLSEKGWLLGNQRSLQPISFTTERACSEILKVVVSGWLIMGDFCVFMVFVIRLKQKQ